MAEINGVLVGIVVDTRDPLQQRRLKVRLPSIEAQTSEWARVAIGFRRVDADRAAVNDEVLVAFEGGDVRRPVVIGRLWSDTDVPPVRRPQKVQLPTGSVLHAIGAGGGAALCASTTSLLQQTAPWLASTDCMMRVLRLLRPLIDVITGLPSPRASALQAFASAALDLQPCFLSTTAGAALPFVRDLLCLVLQALRCVLEDAQKQAVPTEAISSIQAILDSAGPFVAAIGVQPIQLAAVTNIEALPADIVRLQMTVDALGGCAE